MKVNFDSGMSLTNGYVFFQHNMCKCLSVFCKSQTKTLLIGSGLKKLILFYYYDKVKYEKKNVILRKTLKI